MKRGTRRETLRERRGETDRHEERKREKEMKKNPMAGWSRRSTRGRGVDRLGDG